jgi:hypothetical protein
MLFSWIADGRLQILMATDLKSAATGEFQDRAQPAAGFIIPHLAPEIDYQ